MKEGGSLRGLNTAATLWCSAAVGACAGAGELLDAVFVTTLLVGINLALRPLSRDIDRRSLAHSMKETDSPAIYRLSVVCTAPEEARVRALLLRSVAERPLLLRELRTEDIGESEEVFVRAEVESNARDNAVIEDLASPIRSDDSVSKVEWSEAALEPE